MGGTAADAADALCQTVVRAANHRRRPCDCGALARESACCRGVLNPAAAPSFFACRLADTPNTVGTGTEMLKYLPGILIVQAATAALVFASLKTEDNQLLMAMGGLALVINLVTAFWFASIAAHARKDAIAKVREESARERESLRVDAEREKSKLMKESHENITRQTNKAHARANFKVGAAFAGIMGAGVLMIFTQFLSLGLLTLATGGGALAGYLARLKQDYTAVRSQQPPLVIARDPEPRLPVIVEEKRESGTG